MITDKVMLKNYQRRMSLTIEQREKLERFEDQEILRRWEACLRHEQIMLAYEKVRAALALGPQAAL